MSILLPPPAPSASTSLSTSDTLTALARQTAHLQAQLQTLLDAQSHGLSAGLGRGAPSAPSSPPPPASAAASRQRLASNSPLRASFSSASQTTRNTTSSPSRRQQQQQQKQKQHRPSLSAARAGIHTTLVALAHAKAGEHAALCARLEGCSGFLKNAARLGRKRAALEARIVALEAGEEDDDDDDYEEEERGYGDGGQRGRQGGNAGGEGDGGGGRQLQRLAQEEEQLVRDVHVLEEELAVKKARLMHVRRRRDEGASRLEARLSSWRAALEEVERRVQEEVLDGRALPDGLGEGVATGTGKANGKGKGSMGEESVWALPKARRTLELVKEGVVEQVRELEGRIGDAEEEGEACVEGAGVWKGVAGTVAKVEAALKRELGRMNGGGRDRRSSSTTGSDVSETAADKTAEEGMQGVLQKMQAATAELEQAYREAESRGWRLLICAIGAELGALSEGRDMLEKAFGMSQVTLDGLQVAENDSQKTVNGTEAITTTRLENGNGSNLVNVGSEEEDDGPSEDLLFSRVE